MKNYKCGSRVKLSGNIQQI